MEVNFIKSREVHVTVKAKARWKIYGLPGRLFQDGKALNPAHQLCGLGQVA